MKTFVGRLINVTVTFLLLINISQVSGREVGISADIHSIRVMHGDKWVTVKRNQRHKNVIRGEFARTSRSCPPFCIQPIQVAPGVETYGTLEVIYFIERKSNSGSGIVVDARTPDWNALGTIPGSINIPYTDLDRKLGADDFSIEFSLEMLGVGVEQDKWDFLRAKELLVWCNGPWCGQSPTAIRALLALGYPAGKIKYYRGGMQMWKLMGLTVLPPAE